MPLSVEGNYIYYWKQLFIIWYKFCSKRKKKFKLSYATSFFFNFEIKNALFLEHLKSSHSQFIWPNLYNRFNIIIIILNYTILSYKNGYQQIKYIEWSKLITRRRYAIIYFCPHKLRFEFKFSIPHFTLILQCDTSINKGFYNSCGFKDSHYYSINLKHLFA